MSQSNIVRYDNFREQVISEVILRTGWTYEEVDNFVGSVYDFYMDGDDPEFVADELINNVGENDETDILLVDDYERHIL